MKLAYFRFINLLEIVNTYEKTRLFWAFLRSFWGIWWFHLLCIPLGKNWGNDFLHLQNEQGSPTPLLGKNLFGCFQPYVAEKAASQRGKGRFPTFGENLWDSPGEKSGENSGKDFWGIKNGCGKPLGKGIFPETPKVVNSMRATKGIPF